MGISFFPNFLSRSFMVELFYFEYYPSVNYISKLNLGGKKDKIQLEKNYRNNTFVVD